MAQKTSQKSNLNVEPIEELEVVNSSENYIKDLESEIDTLASRVKSLQLELKRKPEVIDIDYKIKYHQLLKSFHILLEEVLPF